ncbi:MAG: ribulokinase [Gemmatimonadales bacterium]
MTVVAGVDFGTESVRVSIVDDRLGVIGFSVAPYPIHRSAADPDFATQSHQDHLSALTAAMHGAIREAGIDGRSVAALALDTTGSTVVVCGDNLEPIGDYYLWCDHRAAAEAARITEVAHQEKLPAIGWCGGVYSSEWGYAKLLHWLKHHPAERRQAVAAFEHCDLIAAVLCGIADPDRVPRSVCAMGHKWLWQRDQGGLPPNEFLVKVDPVLDGSARLLRGRYATSDAIAGQLTADWADRLGLAAGIPIPVGAFDAHWDAIGAGIAVGDVVNVVGTATCTMAISDQPTLVPGVCGVVPGSIDPGRTGIEAGLSATGYLFGAIAARAGVSVGELTGRVAGYRAGETGLLRLTWDNGDRTVLVNPALGGVTFGWNLNHRMEDELFAAIEGTAFHTRIILDRMAEHGVPIERVILGGGIPQKNELLNRIYADVFGKPVLIPAKPITSLGSAIFAFLAAGTFRTVAEAQRALCPEYRIVQPSPAAGAVYAELYPMYRDLYFSFGVPGSPATAMGDVLPRLRRIAAGAREG